MTSRALDLPLTIGSTGRLVNMQRGSNIQEGRVVFNSLDIERVLDDKCVLKSSCIFLVKIQCNSVQ